MTVSTATRVVHHKTCPSRLHALFMSCSAAVKKALGVDEEADWQECNMGINAAFYGKL